MHGFGWHLCLLICFCLLLVPPWRKPFLFIVMPSLLCIKEFVGFARMTCCFKFHMLLINFYQSMDGWIEKGHLLYSWNLLCLNIKVVCTGWSRVRCYWFCFVVPLQMGRIATWSGEYRARCFWLAYLTLVYRWSMVDWEGSFNLSSKLFWSGWILWNYPSLHLMDKRNWNNARIVGILYRSNCRWCDFALRRLQVRCMTSHPFEMGQVLVPGVMDDDSQKLREMSEIGHQFLTTM